MSLSITIPLLAKLVAWAPDRDAAISRLKRALSEYKVGGIRTNLAFFQDILRDDAFVRGAPLHGVLRRFLRPPETARCRAYRDSDEMEAVAAIVASLSKPKPVRPTATPVSKWKWDQ